MDSLAHHTFDLGSVTFYVYPNWALTNGYRSKVIGMTKRYVEAMLKIGFSFCGVPKLIERDSSSFN
jgi:hypothetical protein